MLIRNPPIRITENLVMLGTAPYPLYWVEQAETAAVFEGGTGAMGPLVAEQIQSLQLEPGRAKYLIVTHAHPDHVMAVPRLRQLFPAARVLASEAAAKTLQNEKAVAFFCRLDDTLTASLQQTGLVGPGHRRPPLETHRIPVDSLLQEGDTVPVGGLAFQVLHTPGHSDCSLSFFEPETGILLVSDATGYYMPDFDAWWPNYFVDYGQYLQSMTRLASLRAQVLCLSHNAAIQGAQDVQAYFDAALTATQQYHQRIVAEANSGTTLQQMAEQLGAEVHQKVPLFPLDFFQKNCALLVKNSLRHEGLSPAPSG